MKSSEITVGQTIYITRFELAEDRSHMKAVQGSVVVTQVNEKIIFVRYPDGLEMPTTPDMFEASPEASLRAAMSRLVWKKITIRGEILSYHASIMSAEETIKVIEDTLKRLEGGQP